MGVGGTMRNQWELARIVVKDFGPIAKANIVLKPLTIFFGKNNTGKTYMGYLAWYLANREYLARLRANIFHSTEFNAVSKKIEHIIKSLNPLQHSKRFPLKQFKYAGHFGFSPKVLVSRTDLYKLFNFPMKYRKILIEYYPPFKVEIGIRIMETISSQESLLERTFPPNSSNVPKNLIPVMGFGKVQKDQHTSKKNSLAVGVNESIKPFEFEVVVFRKKDKYNRYYACITVRSSVLRDDKTIKEIARGLLREVSTVHIRQIFRNSIFIPASKSGFILVSKHLASQLVVRALSGSSIFIEDEDIAVSRYSEESDLNLPSPIVDFIRKDPAFSDSYSDKPTAYFRSIWRFLENELIKGHLEYNRILNTIRYRPFLDKNVSLPLQYSSSLVDEASPLLLYLKYSRFVEPKTLLIIEEPEAHLHPDAQRVLARALVKLVNRGVYVVLITHSPYILQQINNNIKLYYLKKAGKEKELKEFLKNHGWEEDEILDPSKVAPYLFDNNEGYTKIRELEIFRDEGISSEAFYYTIMELLKETEELTELLSGSSERGNGEEYDPEDS